MLIRQAFAVDFRPPPPYNRGSRVPLTCWGNSVARISAGKKFKAIFAILEKQFGRRERYRPRPPIEQALVTLLLKNGKERGAELAIKRLQKAFVDWNEARVCDGEHMDRILGRGYPPGVGKLVADALTAIFNHAQAMTLDDITSLDANRAEARLRRLTLLPSRVAGELLLTLFDYGKLPEGTGMLRVAGRTKVIRHGPAEAQIKSMRRIVPKSLVPRAFHAFEMLAERICTPKDFDCPSCPLKDLCPTGAATLKRLAIQEEKARLAQEAEDLRVKKKRQRDRKVRARKRKATARLKKAIQVRSKKLKIPTEKKRRRRTRARPVVTAATKMVQASSAEVKPDRTKRKRRTKKPRRPPQTGATRKK